MKTFKEFLNETIDIKENLNEMATVYRDKGKKQLCQVNPDKGRQCLEYFKLYDSDSFDKATKIARISFREPKYVIHKDENGLQPWIFNNREKKLLIEYLNLKENFYNRELTYFQIAIVKHNFESGLGNSEFDCLNKTIELKNNKYLKLDLQIPNYLLL